MPILFSKFCERVYSGYLYLEPIIPSALRSRKTFSNFLKSRPKVVITSEVNSKISYYPHILLIFDYSSKKTCPETVWQLREDKISINNKKYLICY